MKKIATSIILFTMVMAVIANAQQPPAGAVLWLKADTGVVTDPNSVVTTWQDQSGNSNNATLFMGAPKLETTSFSNGDHNVIRFNGADGLSLTNVTSTQLTTFSCFIVAGIDPGSVSQQFMNNYSVGDASNQYGWSFGLSDSQVQRVKHFTGQYVPGVGSQTMEGSVPLTANKDYLLEFAVDSRSGTSSLKKLCQYDETGRVSKDICLHSLIRYDTVNPQNAYIGVLDIRGWGGLIQYLTGNIAEILIYDTTLDPNTISAQALNYLGGKYGFVIPADVPFNPNDPDAVWDISKQFVLGQNPANNWSYGWGFGMDDFHLYDTAIYTGTGGSPVWYDSATPDPMGQGPLLWKNVAAPAYGVPTGQVSVHPSPDRLAKARWTSVINDVVACTGSFGADGGGTVDVSIVKDGTEVLLEVKNVSGNVPFDVRSAVVAGTTIDFVIGIGPSWGAENTHLDIQITRGVLRCQDAKVYLPGDINQDCYINLEDFARFAQDWLKCNDPLDPACTDVP